MNVNTQRIVSTTVWSFQAKKYHNFSILLSKIAEIHVWNKLKWNKKAATSAQILSAMKSNEQVLTDSQCNG